MTVKPVAQLLAAFPEAPELHKPLDACAPFVQFSQSPGDDPVLHVDAHAPARHVCIVWLPKPVPAPQLWAVPVLQVPWAYW